MHRHSLAQRARARSELDDAVAAHTLREILSGVRHDDLLDARVGAADGPRGQAIVGSKSTMGQTTTPSALSASRAAEIGLQERVHPRPSVLGQSALRNDSMT